MAVACRRQRSQCTDMDLTSPKPTTSLVKPADAIMPQSHRDTVECRIQARHMLLQWLVKMMCLFFAQFERGQHSYLGIDYRASTWLI